MPSWLAPHLRGCIAPLLNSPVPPHLFHHRFSQTTATFYSAFQELVHYVRNVKKSTETQFVYIDGHSSHFCEEAFVLAAACEFVFIFLPAHMSSRLQPADTGLNAAFKAIIRLYFERMMGYILFLELSIPLLNGVSRHT